MEECIHCHSKEIMECSSDTLNGTVKRWYECECGATWPRISKDETIKNLKRELEYAKLAFRSYASGVQDGCEKQQIEKLIENFKRSYPKAEW